MHFDAASPVCLSCGVTSLRVCIFGPLYFLLSLKVFPPLWVDCQFTNIWDAERKRMFSLLTWHMADTSEELKSFISTISLWKSPERIGEIMGGKSARRGIERVWRSKTWGGGGIKKAKALEDYLFSSPSLHLAPSLSSLLLVWTHDHSSSVSVHIMTIFSWEQRCRQKRIRGRCRSKAHKQHNLDVCQEQWSRFHQYSNKLFCLFLVFNTPQRNNTRLLTLSTQYSEHPQVPSLQSRCCACHRCLRSHSFSGGEMAAAAAIGRTSAFITSDKGPAERPWAIKQGMFFTWAHNWLMFHLTVCVRINT